RYARPLLLTLFPYTTLFRSIVGQRHGVGGEGVGLDDVGPRIEIGGVDRPDDAGLSERQQIAVAPQLARPVGKALTAIIALAQSIDRKSTRLNSSHGSISYAV